MQDLQMPPQKGHNNNDDRVESIPHIVCTDLDFERLLMARENAFREQTDEQHIYPPGAGVKQLSLTDTSALRSIYRKLSRTESVPWGNGWTDRRRRNYGMLTEHSKWKKPEDLVKVGIRMHDAGDTKSDTTHKHLHTISNCFASLDLDDDELAAIHSVVSKTNEVLEYNKTFLKEYERNCVRVENLVAVQTNVHHKVPLLPLHFDEPLQDGFGVVVVTVAIEGSADIIIMDTDDSGIQQPTSCENATDRKHWRFPVKSGEMYVLSGPARNMYVHGVIVTRFGSQLPETTVDSGAATLTRRTNNMYTDIWNQHPDPNYDASNQSISARVKKRRGNCTTINYSPSFGASKVCKREDRISLNFRFGVHSKQQIRDDINIHWVD